MKLSEAKAVITGGASGLGYATAERVIGAGGHVVLLDINDELGEASAAKLGDRAAYLNTDVANEASVKESIAKANEIMGGITLAVNCAGIAPAEKTLGRDGPHSLEGFRRVIDFSGDTMGNTFGPPITQARDEVVAAGITINALPIIRNGDFMMNSLPQAYEDNIIGGPGAFVMPARVTMSPASASSMAV